MLSRHILLFAGQGSKTLSPDNDVRQILSASAVAAAFIEGCYDVFQEEIRSLETWERIILGSDVCELLKTPEILTDPPSVLHTNPVIQGLTLYVHQILSFLSYKATISAPVYPELHSTAETAGFCFGLLTAIIIASCPDGQSIEFHRRSVEGFRLAFWISLRSAVFCRTHCEDSSSKGQSWSLAVFNFPVAELKGLLDRYNKHNGSNLPLRISAIVSEQAISVCGQGTTLHDFQANYLPTSVSSRFANIHGYYHGGAALQMTLSEVMIDVQRRDIAFPSRSALQVPVRSTCGGKYLNSGTSSSLLEAALQEIFIHGVEWKLLLHGLVESAVKCMEQETRLSYRIQALGPNARTLLSATRNAPIHHPRLVITNLIRDAGRAMHSEDIAIVGMSINYPSGKGPEQFWHTLVGGHSVMQEIPASRFNFTQYFDAGTGDSKPRNMISKHGNFLENPFEFDNTFFHISPREAMAMDPQQRLLLHAALEALEDAGYAPNSSPAFQTEGMGIYIGVATGDYVDNTRHNIDIHYSPGTLRAFLSGRISYAFKFKGPSVVIDTACSSSTVALYQACRALQAGDCTTALAGGVNVISSPDMYLGLSRAHFLSPSGQCKPFDRLADGYCRAEGCGLFVLKRLSDAVAECDRIYGVIRGIEVNQSGAAKSITHPDSQTQAELLKRLFRKSNVDPFTIGVVEAHGTGTQAGDLAEFVGLQTAFGSDRLPNNPLIISSVKGHIGHSEAASGAAGLAKILLMMQEKQIPPQCSYKDLNPRLVSLADHNFVIPSKLEAWRVSHGAQRRALLSNFGAAGSNAALIVEEYHRLRPKHATFRSYHLLTISAKTSKALEELRAQYVDLLQNKNKTNQLSPLNLCYSANSRREQYAEYRLSVCGQNMEEMLQRLQQVSPQPRRFVPKRKGKIIFVFSGQGAIFPGMGAELLSTCPIFSQTVHACDNILINLGFPAVYTFIKSETCSDPDNTRQHELNVTTQAACFVLEYALAKVWMEWGVEPDILVGHSLGEYTALAMSGVLSLHDALFLVVKRAELMDMMCEKETSGMVACNMSSCEAQTILTQHKEYSPGISIACHNSLNDCVVAGPMASLGAFRDHCRLLGHKTKILDVPYGFHSCAMEPIQKSFKLIADTVKQGPLKIPVVSSYFGRVLTVSDIGADYFVNHMLQPVDFVKAAQVVAEQAGDNIEMTFLEIGPAPSTLPLVKSTLKQHHIKLIPSLKRSEKPWITLVAALEQLYLQRYPLKWTNVYDGAGTEFLPNLPRYPLSPSTFVMPFREPETSRPATNREGVTSPYKLLCEGTLSTSHNGAIAFESSISSFVELIKAHNVAGFPLCPASVYIELGLEVLHNSTDKAGTLDFDVLEDVEFAQALVYIQNPEKKIRVTFHATESRFEVASGEGTLHCVGLLSTTSDASVRKDFYRKSLYIKRQRQYASISDTLSSRMLYEVVFPRVVTYSKPYLTIKQLEIVSSGLEAYGTFEIDSSHIDGFVYPPTFNDTLLHAAGFVANSKISSEEACICVKIERITMPTRAVDVCHGEKLLYCSLLEAAGELIGDAYAIDASGEILSAIEGIHFKKHGLKTFQAYLSRIGHQNDEILPGPSEDGEYLATGNNRFKGNSHAVTNLSYTRPFEDAVYAPQQLRLREILRDKIQILCGLNEVLEVDAELSDLGVDSLLLIELVQELQTSFSSLSISSLDLERCSTLQEMEQVILSASIAASMQDLSEDIPMPRTPATQLTRDTPLGPNTTIASLPCISAQVDAQVLDTTLQEFPEQIQSGSELVASLYLVHDGSGLCNKYARMDTLGRNIYSIPSLDLFNFNNSIKSVEELSSLYIDKAKLARVRTTSMILGGWSFGGVVAFEISRQLRRRGYPVKGVVLLDSPVPINHDPLPGPIISQVCEQMAKKSPARSNLKACIEAQFRRSASFLGDYHPEPDFYDVPCIMLKCEGNFDAGVICGAPYPWLSDESVRHDAIKLWEMLIGRSIPVIPIRGHHFDMLSTEHIGYLSLQLERACKILEDTEGQ